MAVLVLAGGVRAAETGESKPSWADSVKLSGDVRVRHEYIDQEGKSERNRDRVRARLKIEGKVNDQVKATVRVASGSDDPVSTNQSFDDGFSKKGLNLDMAFVKWSVADAFALLGGKMGKPWEAVADLVWDGDLTPEGFAAQAEVESEAVTLMANAGLFWLDEISSEKDDRLLYTGQVGAECKMGEAKCTVGASVYAYDGMMGLSTLADPTDGFGNSVVSVTDEDGETTASYATDYTIFEVFAALDFQVGNLPMKLYGQYAMNDDATNEDTGYLAGLKVGKAKKPGQVEFNYNYRSLEKDAVVGAYTDSDFGGGGTNGEGHKLGGKVAIAKNWTAGATVFQNTIDPSGKDLDYTRVQIDLVAKF